jgi:hypothetical protein
LAPALQLVNIPSSLFCDPSDLGNRSPPPPPSMWNQNCFICGPHRLYCVEGCWVRTQDCCFLGIDSFVFLCPLCSFRSCTQAQHNLQSACRTPIFDILFVQDVKRRDPVYLTSMAAHSGSCSAPKLFALTHYCFLCMTLVFFFFFFFLKRLALKRNNKKTTYDRALS